MGAPRQSATDPNKTKTDTLIVPPQTSEVGMGSGRARFIRVGNEILNFMFRHYGRRGSAFCVHLALIERANWLEPDQPVRISCSELRAATGISRTPTLRRAIDDVLASGLVAQEGTQGGWYTFRVTRVNGSAGWTRVPQAFFDALPDLTGAEAQVALFLYRKTLGWGKQADHISYSQIRDGDRHVAGTGLNYDTIRLAAEHLTSVAVLPGISRTANGYRGTYRYTIDPNATLRKIDTHDSGVNTLAQKSVESSSNYPHSQAAISRRVLEQKSVTQKDYRYKNIIKEPLSSQSPSDASSEKNISEERVTPQPSSQSPSTAVTRVSTDLTTRSSSRTQPKRPHINESAKSSSCEPDAGFFIREPWRGWRFYLQQNAAEFGVGAAERWLADYGVDGLIELRSIAERHYQYLLRRGDCAEYEHQPGVYLAHWLHNPSAHDAPPEARTLRRGARERAALIANAPEIRAGDRVRHRGEELVVHWLPKSGWVSFDENDYSGVPAYECTLIEPAQTGAADSISRFIRRKYREPVAA